MVVNSCFRSTGRVLSLERFPPEANAHFLLEGVEAMVMSWGGCDVFCYRRRDLYKENAPP